MYQITKSRRFDIVLFMCAFFLVSFSVVVLYSIANYLFPLYLLFIFISFLAYFLILKIDFDILSLFSNHLYIFSIFFLALPLIIGQVSRGAVRWISLGTLTLQPAEIVRPLLILFFANYLSKEEVGFKLVLKSLGLLSIPLALILIQPSLGMTILTAAGFVGVLLASRVNKKYLFTAFAAGVLIIPLVFQFLAPYQKQRINSFLNPANDPSGGGYNSIQSVIAVGSGQVFGRGLGKGVQTQLSFLPEKHTDFVFASISEELGFLGALIVIVLLLILFWRLSVFIDMANTRTGSMFLSGVLISLLCQVFINLGMNLGILPITGLPLPFVSAGGSSLLGMMITLGVVESASRA